MVGALQLRKSWVSFERFWRMEVHFGIAPAALRRRLARAVLRVDALHHGPRLIGVPSAEK